MQASNDEYWHPGYAGQSEEDESDDDECITLNYDDFFKYRKECSLWSPTDESQDEDYDFDESNFQRHNIFHHQHHNPNSERRMTARGKHSCLKLKDGYCYLDPSVYDTRVMRNLSTTDHDLPCKSYSPKFIQAALAKTESLTSWSDDDQMDDLVDYNTQEMEDFDGNSYNDPIPPQPQERFSEAVEFSGEERCDGYQYAGYNDLECDKNNAYLAKIGKVIYRMCEQNDAFSDVSDATTILEALKKSSVFPTPSIEHIQNTIPGGQLTPDDVLKHGCVSNAVGYWNK